MLSSEFFHVEFPPSVLAWFPAIHLLEALSLLLFGCGVVTGTVFTFSFIVTIVLWSAHSTRDGCRISCLLRVYAKFGFSALVILLFLIIVAQIYLAAGIRCQHPGMSFFRILAILACSLFHSPWIFFNCRITAEFCFLCVLIRRFFVCTGSQED